MCTVFAVFVSKRAFGEVLSFKTSLQKQREAEHGLGSLFAVEQRLYSQTTSIINCRKPFWSTTVMDK